MLWPNAGHGLIREVSRLHTLTHHSRWDSSGRVISPSQRSLPDNTQHSKQTDIHVRGGIRTLNLGRRAAADVRLRPRCHRDWLEFSVLVISSSSETFLIVLSRNLQLIFGTHFISADVVLRTPKMFVV